MGPFLESEIVRETALVRIDTAEMLEDAIDINPNATLNRLLQNANLNDGDKENRRQRDLSTATASTADGGAEAEQPRVISSAVSELMAKIKADQTGIYFKRLMRERGINPEPMTRRTSHDFYFHVTLGYGAFSNVYLTTEVDTKRRYAMKVLETENVVRRNMVLNVLRERDILAALTYAYGGHPFIVQLYCTFREPKHLFFALSYAERGDLLHCLDQLSSFDETVTLFYASEILEGLAFLHNCRIVHRDLKPENILIRKDCHIQITDFGAAKVLDLDDGVVDAQNEGSMTKAERPKGRSSFVGTAYYVSPEVILHQSVGQECDYWALGTIIFQMISGHPPFRAISDFPVFKKIVNLDYKFPDGFPQTARDLIKRLLVLKADRLGSLQNGGVAALKAHHYFESVDWATITERTPPVLLPYVPATKDEPAFYGSHAFVERIPDCRNIEPGLTEAAMRRVNFAEFGAFHTACPTTTTALTASFKPLSDAASAWPAELSAEESKIQRRERQLAAQRAENAYHSFVDGHLILKYALLNKRKGLSTRKRMFLLTEGPHLYYVDPDRKELKGEIPLSAEVRTETKNFRNFFVYTPQRTYYLSDEGLNAIDWCEAIDLVVKRSFPPVAISSPTPR